MNSASRLLSRTFLLPHFSLQGAHPATTDSAKRPGLEPKDLDMIPRKENTAHLSTTRPQQRRLEWNIETLMRFRRRKLRPTHLKVTQQWRPGVEPEDLDVKPKKKTTAHPWSTSDSEAWFLMRFRRRKLQPTHLQANQQRGLVWNQKILMRFRRRKLQPTHLQANQQRGLVWNLKILMRFRNRKLQPTYL